MDVFNYMFDQISGMFMFLFSIYQQVSSQKIHIIEQTVVSNMCACLVYVCVACSQKCGVAARPLALLYTAFNVLPKHNITVDTIPNKNIKPLPQNHPITLCFAKCSYVYNSNLLTQHKSPQTQFNHHIAQTTTT